MSLCLGGKKNTKTLRHKEKKMTQERKYIIIGGLILLLIGAVYRFAPEQSFSVFQSFKDEISIQEKRLEKYRQILQDRNQIEARLLSLTRSLDHAESGLLTGETPPLAAVDIQNILNEIAGKSNIEVKTMRVLNPEEPVKESPVKNYLGIPVEITLSANIRQLKEVLYKIETSPKILKISDMKIRLISNSDIKEVYATLIISGFMKK